MTGTVTVTPGQVFTNEDLTPTRLNALGLPTMALAAGSVSKRELNIPEIIPNLTPIRKEQLFRNPTLQRDTWRDLSGVSCTADTRVDNAAGWYALASGAAPTYAEAAFSETLNYVQRGAKITGNTSVTTVLFGQFIRSDIARLLKAAGSMTISFALENQTGASLSTAVVSVQPTATENSGGGVSEATTGAVDTVADGAAAFVDVTITTSSITNLENGFYLAVKFPSGSLDGTGKHVIVGAFRLQAGSTASAWEAPESAEPWGLQPRSVWDESSDPDYTNDSAEGFGQSSYWRNSTDDKIWICLSAAVDNAVWRELCRNNESYGLFLSTQTSGTAGGGITTSNGTGSALAWNSAPITVANRIIVGSNAITVYPGVYRVRAVAYCYRCGAAKLGLRSSSSTTVLQEGVNGRSPGSTAVNTGMLVCDSMAREDAGGIIYLVPWAIAARATDGLGPATSLGSADEVYAIVEVFHKPEIYQVSGVSTAEDVWTENVDLNSDLSGYDPNGASDTRTVLLVGQTDKSENGLWHNPGQYVSGTPVGVQVDLGSAYTDRMVKIRKGSLAGTQWIQIDTVATVGTDDMTWLQGEGYDTDLTL